MSNNNQSWTSVDDFFFYFLMFVFLGIPFIFFFFWFNQHDLCLSAILYFFHTQIKILSFFTSSLASLDQQLYFIDYNKVTLHHVWSIQEMIGYYYRYPVLIVILISGFFCFHKTLTILFKRKFNLRKFMQEQAKNFPISATFSKKEMPLCRIDLARPLMNDPALKLDEWVNRYATSSGQFDEEKAKAELILQLGERWNGVEKASPLIRILYTVFALHLNNQSSQARKLLERFSQEVSNENIPASSPHKIPENVLKQADDLQKEIKNIKRLTDITACHAWSNTALMSLLYESRKQSGVFPPSFFVAIKLIDRKLWYALHSLGFPGKNFSKKNHPNPYIEAAGARAHWEREVFVKKPLASPQFSIVIKTILNLLHVSG